ncbi:hypothetical protein SDJN02_16964, partial [Cucurbita argyrosperma subsp. argyrosperma]
MAIHQVDVAKDRFAAVKIAKSLPDGKWVHSYISGYDLKEKKKIGEIVELTSRRLWTLANQCDLVCERVSGQFILDGYRILAENICIQSLMLMLSGSGGTPSCHSCWLETCVDSPASVHHGLENEGTFLFV